MQYSDCAFNVHFACIASILDSSVTSQELVAQPLPIHTCHDDDESIRLTHEVNDFESEKERFQRELGVTWETDDDNDVVVCLSKQMCLLMVDITDYTRGVGIICTDFRLIEVNIYRSTFHQF